MAKDTFLNRKLTLNSKGILVDLTTPSVMAIVNITPDSFFADSRANDVKDALKKVEVFMNEGATFIDVGAYSSRPGAKDVSEKEELERITPAIQAINKEFPDAIISVDTFRAKVAEEAVFAGAHVINDIAGGELDGNMFDTVAKLQVPYVMMHMKGTPQNMQQNPVYDDVVAEVFSYFNRKVQKLKSLGVKDIILDPGFGFAKTITHNYQLLQKLESLNVLELPILVGFSRKSMITKVLDIKTTDALNGTTILNTIALQKGANILRVHDVKFAKECITICKTLKDAFR